MKEATMKSQGAIPKVERTIVEEQQVIKQSYSKMMKSIGAELKNINPFLYNQSRSKQGPTKATPGHHSSNDFNMMPSENQEQQTNALLSHNTNEVTSNMSNTNAGVTGLIGMPVRAAPMTAQHGQRRKLRPQSPNTQLVNLNISATVNSSTVFQVQDAQSSEQIHHQRIRSGYTQKQDSETVIGLGQSHGQMRIKQNLNSESKRDQYDVRQDESRANLIVDNLVIGSSMGDANKVFLGTKISQRILNQPSGAQLNMSKSGFTHSYRKNISRPITSKGLVLNQSNGSIAYPHRVAGLELLQKDTRQLPPQVQQELINYNGVFSAKTFEMIVPEDDQIIRVAQLNNYNVNNNRQMSQRISPRQMRGSHTLGGGSAKVSIAQTPVDYLQSRRNLQRGTSSIQELRNQITSVRASQRQSLNMAQLASAVTPNASNKLRVFQRLKKGTVFKDGDFEAKKPSNDAGFKLI
ncbi:hypothetical protein FGO68_gene7641 [Halteria grandinella]|uniref:Uncharacterized protein n=1 Tax=Halteria grandinella TaxID=5974 RepID=A0A8J8T9Y6_HALGN|nr:hypothetical protein FGO68_gene7641 [Halteria grandinella]